jgi:hypothetical protein
LDLELKYRDVDQKLELRQRERRQKIGASRTYGQLSAFA